jgi:hypothetical protein
LFSPLLGLSKLIFKIGAEASRILFRFNVKKSKVVPVHTTKGYRRQKYGSGRRRGKSQSSY